MLSAGPELLAGIGWLGAFHRPHTAARALPALCPSSRVCSERRVGSSAHVRCCITGELIQLAFPLHSLLQARTEVGGAH